jgi:hypothetical protein
MKSPIIFDLDGALAESKSDLMARQAAPLAERGKWTPTSRSGRR